jgi:hypothetical protein
MVTVFPRFLLSLASEFNCSPWFFLSITKSYNDLQLKQNQLYIDIMKCHAL